MGGGKIKHQHFNRHGNKIMAQRYEKISIYARKTLKFYVLLPKIYVLLHFQAILTQKRQLFHIGVKIDTS